jgi:hypothetical protein
LIYKVTRFFIQYTLTQTLRSASSLALRYKSDYLMWINQNTVINCIRGAGKSVLAILMSFIDVIIEKLVALVLGNFYLLAFMSKMNHK